MPLHYSTIESAEGPTFSLPIKIAAGAVVGFILILGLHNTEQLFAATWSVTALTLLPAAAAVTLVCYFRMLKSRTAIDSEYIHQDFFWSKKIALADITQARFVYLPYMSWLVAPRLLVRVRSLGFFVFYAGNVGLETAFARLALMDR